jgi:hypothetical protein
LYSHVAHENIKSDSTFQNTYIQRNDRNVISDLLKEPSQTVQLISSNFAASSSQIKNHIDEFSLQAFLFDKLFFNTFYQYNFFANNLIQRFCSTDIVFPFHFFL